MDKACAIGVDYYEKGESAHDNPCPGRIYGQHPFDHPVFQVVIPFSQLLYTVLTHVLCSRPFCMYSTLSYMLESSCLAGAPVERNSEYDASRRIRPTLTELVQGTAPPINPIIFLPLALCDLVGLIMMTISLDLTYVSDYQVM
jgi:hypothetical protein